MIFVTVGSETRQKFNRLFVAIDNLIENNTIKMNGRKS